MKRFRWTEVFCFCSEAKRWNPLIDEIKRSGRAVYVDMAASPNKVEVQVEEEKQFDTILPKNAGEGQDGVEVGIGYGLGVIGESAQTAREQIYETERINLKLTESESKMKSP